MSQDWKQQINAGDYLRDEQKRVDIENRRPVVRRASDLGVGPGIAAAAVRVNNWNDPLATFNGYFASLPGAAFAPNLVESFTGFTVMDSEIGGTQVVTGMASQVQYKRILTRNPGDASSIAFGVWRVTNPGEQSGSLPVPGPTNTNESRTLLIEFIPGRFTVPPIVTANVSGGGVRFNVAVEPATTTGCTVVLFNFTNAAAAACTLWWSARTPG